MNFTNILLTLTGMYLVLCGLATLFTGKVYGHGKSIAVTYTEESIHSAAPMLGISTVFMGLAMIGYKLGSLTTELAFMEKYSYIILFGGLALGTVVMILAYHKMVKKEK